MWITAIWGVENPVENVKFHRKARLQLALSKMPPIVADTRAETLSSRCHRQDDDSSALCNGGVEN